MLGIAQLETRLKLITIPLKNGVITYKKIRHSNKYSIFLTQALYFNSDTFETQLNIIAYIDVFFL
jgi:hypothetical protein